MFYGHSGGDGTLYLGSTDVAEDTDEAGGGGGHTHTGTIVFSAFDTRPQYRALYYVQKVA